MSGKKVEINSRGRVIIGKQLAGERLVFVDGVLVSMGDAPKKSKVMQGEVTRAKRLSVKDCLKAKTLIPLSAIKQDVSSGALKLQSKYQSENVAALEKLTTSGTRNIKRISELQRKSNLTAAEKVEEKRLIKIVAKNYKLSSEFIGKSIAISLIGFGFGSVALVSALKSDPWNTMKLLPENLISAVKSDWGRASSNPLNAVAVATEWIVITALIGKGVGKGLGKVSKTALKQLKRIGNIKIPKRTINLNKPNVRTLVVGSDDYAKAVNFAETFSDNIANAQAKLSINKLKAKGIKLGLGKEEQIISLFRKNARNKLKNITEFKKLQNIAKLTKPTSIKLRKIGKIQAAKTLFNKSKLKIKNTKLANNIKSSVEKIYGKSKKIKGRVRSSMKKVELSQAKELRKFMNAAEYSRQLRAAKKIRRLSRKKNIRNINVGTDEYIKAVAFIENLSDDISILKAKIFIKKIKATGKKFTIGQEDNFIMRVKKYTRSQLEKNTDFKKLQNIARLTKPTTIKLRKIGKIQSAKILFNKLKNKTIKIPVPKRLETLLRKVGKGGKRTIRKIKKSTSPRRIRKNIAKAKIRRKNISDFKKTNRYRMEKSRTVRKVTLKQLQRSKNIGDTRKIIDNLFDEISRRRKIDITSLKYRQFKNSIKKRISNAIRKGDRVEIEKFKLSIKKTLQELNRNDKQPSVRVYEKGSVSKKVRTINDFKPDSPSGKYVEINRGGQVQIQIQKPKPEINRGGQVQIQIQKPKIYIIESVSKKSMNFNSLLDFLSSSSAASSGIIIRNSRQLSRNKSSNRQKSGFSVKSAQDKKTLQANKRSSASKTIVTQKIKEKIKPISKTKVIQRNKNKNIKIKFSKQFKRKTLSKKVPTYFVVEKVRGKFKKLYPNRLTKMTATDYATYSIDNKLSKTAFLIPMGSARIIAQPPKNIQGYFSKNRIKVRPYKIRYGKKKQLVNGFIEKRKYFQDTTGERQQSSRLRRNAATKRNRPKRKITQSQKKVMLRNLKKARAAKRRK